MPDWGTQPRWAQAVSDYPRVVLVALGPWGNSVQYSRTFRYVTIFELIDTQKLNVVVFRNQILS